MLDAMSDFVRIATVESEPEADLAVGLLRTEGITAMWQRSGEPAAGMGIGPVGGIGGLFDVVVLPDDAERAAELLAASESDDDRRPRSRPRTTADRSQRGSTVE